MRGCATSGRAAPSWRAMRPFAVLRALVAAAAFMLPALAASAQSPAPAVANEPLLIPARALVAAFNAAAPYPAELFTDDAIVTDEFPPFIWSGPGGAKTWWTTLVGDPGGERRQKFVAAKERIEIGAPQFVSVAGDRAFFICPSTLQYSSAGKTYVQKGRWQFFLRRQGDAWRIAGHVWDILSDD
jgi:hypothetical protein